MKKYLLILLFLPCLSIGQQSYLDSRGDPQLWGSVEISDLKKETYAEWFHDSTEAYISKNENHVSEGLIDYKVKIYMGTWCGDSKRWVPRFLEQWEALGLNSDRIEIIGLHGNRKLYKQAPDHSEMEYNIHRVPTFIFLKDGKEYARIVESPVNDLYTDVAHIASGYPSTPRYAGVTFLSSVIDTFDLADIKESDIELMSRKISRLVAKPGELNTYAHKLYSDGKIKEAEWVYQLNTHLYPYHPGVLQSMGTFYKNVEDLKKAIEYCHKSLIIEPDNPKLISLLNDLNNSKSD
ncbi:MAG: hypothetical protein HKN68_09090 [Saprospiraceae bacterium]|nr:hypothetical protein [Saprospiraceae bacterium]